jgi:4-alpha-glucanotransferase
VPGEVLPVFDRRRCGVLLHLSSLDAPLGRGGRAFIDWLALAGFSVWQVLPLGPPGASSSPYWVRSDFAGNTAFIDAAERPPADGDHYRRFLEDSRFWLEDYALFEVLGALLTAGSPGGSGGRSSGIATRRRWPAFEESEHAQALARAQAEQFVFATAVAAAARLRARAGCAALRRCAVLRGAGLGGGVDASRAVPARRGGSSRGRSRACPPDYFSELGQLWGNPLYEWARMRRDGFGFWRARVRSQLARVDLLRIDHFRGLAAHWAVPAGAPDARDGALVSRHPDASCSEGARAANFPCCRLSPRISVLSRLMWRQLRRQISGIPGMRVLQFGFDGKPAKSASAAHAAP